MSIDIAAAEQAFTEAFGRTAETVVRAPGRVNIIGEHTDYNHGFVLPMALERETVIVAAPREDRLLNAFAVNLDARAQGDLSHCVRDPQAPWLDYVMGVARELEQMGRAPSRGADLLIQGDVPVASGLSSSAALEMAALCLFESLDGFRMDGAEAARLGQRVENDFLGLSTGIMDQFISRCGKAGHALFLDCRSHEYTLVPVALPGAVFVVANTCCARGLTSSKYNERVAECREAVEAMAETLGREGTHLRDYTAEDLSQCRGAMSSTAFRRARHVITEDDRTRAACEAMHAGDTARLGELMTASDASLREDYAVTSPELDAMTEVARALPGCHGARMTGAGFGGCTISLVDEAVVKDFSEALLRGYKTRTGIDGEIIVSRPGDGARIVR